MPNYDDTRWHRDADGVRTRLHLGAAAESVEDDSGVNATEAAVARAAELGVDLATVTGTGKNGRITVGDVEAAAQ